MYGICVRAKAVQIRPHQFEVYTSLKFPSQIVYLMSLAFRLSNKVEISRDSNCVLSLVSLDLGLSIARKLLHISRFTNFPNYLKWQACHKPYNCQLYWVGIFMILCRQLFPTFGTTSTRNSLRHSKVQRLLKKETHFIYYPPPLKSKLTIWLKIFMQAQRLPPLPALW